MRSVDIGDVKRIFILKGSGGVQGGVTLPALPVKWFHR